jgi:hypothetical protein
MFKQIVFTALLFTCSLTLGQTDLAFTYTSGPHSSYPDSSYNGSTGELNDAVDAGVAWGAGVSLTYADVDYLSGWLYTNPVIRFQFAETVTIDTLTVWSADSNGHAGVALPSAINLTDDTSSFSLDRLVTDPPGSGQTIPLVFTGLNLTTDHVVFSATRSQSWTMFSEFTFSGVPEPAHASFLGALCALLAVYRRVQQRLNWLCPLVHQCLLPPLCCPLPHSCQQPRAMSWPMA